MNYISYTNTGQSNPSLNNYYKEFYKELKEVLSLQTFREHLQKSKNPSFIFQFHNSMMHKKNQKNQNIYFVFAYNNIIVLF